MLHFSAPPPLSLYLHLPWCVRKCPYCDFNSHQLAADIPQQDYIAALLRDLEQDLPRAWGRHIHSIFIGGGTPSLFSPEAIDQLLSSVRALLPVSPDSEITLEANPGTVELGRFKGYRDAGINRLSIGIQSFNDEKLHALGRIHGGTEALRAAETARAAGFDNFNLDLMFGLPRQTVPEALADLKTAIAMQPSHLSLYQLTIEPNTQFHHQPPILPDDDTIWGMQQQLQALLAANNYVQYEVSAYAQPGRQCLHNLNYWRFGDYLGIGAGAHAKITDADGITRLWKIKQPKDYMHNPSGIGGERRLSRREVPLEFMMNALRLTGGFPTSLFQERAGLPLSVAEKPLRRAEERGLIIWDVEAIYPTELGKRFLNEVVALFLPDPN
ncbi:MAG TPA: radical SAM family heme chaperone HemW [Acidiferrobacterales bacterium]|nr:radical SAM family heme chaperone HemW [Acidiferrobacterales bacterium]